MAYDAGTERPGFLAAWREAARGRGLLEIPLGKWLFDKAFAALALMALAPTMGLIALILKLRDPGPVLFAHTRIGKDGRRFKCYKFRTMRADGDARLAWVFAIDPIARADWQAAQKLERDPRVHPFGGFLRRTSLDELPQFWNVLKGDMSIVGPRPIVDDEIEKYGRHFADYCAVRPGITGAWQVGGRTDTDYEARVALDVDYVRTARFRDDLSIVFRTVGVVLKQRGAY
ncbi:sugar transferase [Maritimibacter fusiformis]|uniref:Sugar transferase n=1 Tax=Maritimibacter fusiformis TaxID=2603819 RepID=A0A5D0RNI2_9RHOB|nr:sugar transferase [Maritimibacter fusiformis]TYB82415.1 sugar transferase [Maritimibacter fusiformis]